jgi:hypothetical protein
MLHPNNLRFECHKSSDTRTKYYYISYNLYNLEFIYLTLFMLYFFYILYFFIPYLIIYKLIYTDPVSQQPEI